MHIHALSVYVMHLYGAYIAKKIYKHCLSLSQSPLFEIPLQSQFSAVQPVIPFSKGNSHGVLWWATEIKARAWQEVAGHCIQWPLQVGLMQLCWEQSIAPVYVLIHIKGEVNSLYDNIVLLRKFWTCLYVYYIVCVLLHFHTELPLYLPAVFQLDKGNMVWPVRKKSLLCCSSSAASLSLFLHHQPLVIRLAISLMAVC